MIDEFQEFAFPDKPINGSTNQLFQNFNADWKSRSTRLLWA